MMDRIPKHREELLLGILADIDRGSLEGERLMAYDVSAMGTGRRIQVEGSTGEAIVYGSSLSDLERLADEGYLEVDYQGQTLWLVVLAAARSYRDRLRAIKLAQAQ